jgi:hypothetical protein
MVIAHHLVWTTYGTGLPNDPRGSWSNTVISPDLAELGEIHFGRRKIQPSRQIVREFKQQAEPLLVYPVIRFDARQIERVGAALAEAIHKFNYTCYACAVMPDHVHLLIRQHRDAAETMIENLQNLTRSTLIAVNATIPPEHPIWTAAAGSDFSLPPTPSATWSVILMPIPQKSASPDKTGRSSSSMTVGRFTNNLPAEKVESPAAPVYTRSTTPSGGSNQTTRTSGERGPCRTFVNS